MEQLRAIGGGLKLYVSDIHRFGTDAVMLAYFAAPKKKDKICDLGTGCGIIPLLLSRENREQNITAVDVQADAIDLVRRSCETNSLQNITPICQDLKTLEGDGSFDVVTMNPPYKTEHGGLQSAVDGVRIARHEILCNSDDIVACAYRLLRHGGRLCMCQRPERLGDLLCAMRAGRIEPKRLRTVHQRADKEPMLILLEGVKDGKAGMSIEAPLILETNEGKTTDEVERIYTLYRQAKEE